MNQLNLKSSWHFRTIGLGTINYRAGARRLAKEALSTGLFETSVGFDEKHLKQNSELFWGNHKQILKSRTHGFGFYVWKPEFIKLALAGIPENHGLMYCDAGNLISRKFDDIRVLGSYLNLASESNIVGSNSQNFIERDWSPRELMDHLNLSEINRDSPQFLGGFLLITNTPEGRQFVEQWSDLACQENHNEIVRMLLEAKSDVNIRNNNGWTPLMKACLKGNNDIVVMLLNSNLKVDLNLQNYNSATALIAACFKNHKDIVSILLKAGADPNIKMHDMTPLMFVCKKGSIEIVELLLQAKADATVRFTNNQTAFDFAKGHNDIVQLLIRYSTAN
jgi:hypothetical protein